MKIHTYGIKKYIFLFMMRKMLLTSDSDTAVHPLFIINNKTWALLLRKR